MKATSTRKDLWAAKAEDGLHLYWWRAAKPEHGTTMMLFRTRREARAFLKQERGFIASRPDLRKPPFNWRVGKVVRVTVTVTEL